MLKIVLLAFALIASSVATVLGSIMLFGFQVLLPGSILMILGSVSLPVSIYYMSKANKEYQVSKLKNVLSNPDKILIKFPSKEGKGDIILTDEALYEGFQHYPFASFYESLVDIKLKGNKLCLESEVNGGGNRIPRFKEFEIPSEFHTQAEHAVSRIRIKYLGE